MKAWQLALLCILLTFLVAGIILLVARPVRGIPIVLLPVPTITPTLPPKPSPTSPLLEVQIRGQVLSPGVYLLPASSRLGDLISAAGGFTVLADINRVNDAQIIYDGDYFFVPMEAEEIPETASNAPFELSERSASINFPINLNTASQEELETLPGIGPKKAADIIAYRDEITAFQSLEQLLEVSGIGPSTLETIKEFLYIEP
jgi:competence protein ComEA